MNITEIKYKTFLFDLSSAVTTSQQKIISKKLILVKARNSIGKEIYAEISPLENYSTETINECENVLRNLLTSGIKFPVELETLKKIVNSLNKFPSVKFAFEQLLLSSYLLRNENDYTKLVKQKRIKFNAMIDIKPADETMKEISEMFRKGFDTFKLKIGSENFDEELTLIKKIKEKYKDKIKLRLDVNGNWSCNEAIVNIESLKDCDIEYIEQPVETKDELINLASVMEIPLAPDESIQTYDDAIELIETGYFDFIVLKPSIRTGIFDTIKIIKSAEERNVNVIITSAFETAIARNALYYLASLTTHNYAHGLATRLLGKNILPGPFNVDNGKVQFEIEKLPYKFNLDF